MGSQWVQDLVRMADAIQQTAEDARRRGEPCRFCAAHTGAHAATCPVAVAARVIRQARPVAPH